MRSYDVISKNSPTMFCVSGGGGGGGGGRFRTEESTFVIFFRILLKINGVLCVRRMVKSQKSTAS